MGKMGPGMSTASADADSSTEVEMAIRFREFAGTYMEHCHNTQHEDSSMLLRWDLEHPGQFQLMPTPLPGWDGVQYVSSAALPTFRTDDGNNTGEGTDDSNSRRWPCPTPRRPRPARQ